jgi:hypothetical protein
MTETEPVSETPDLKKNCDDGLRQKIVIVFMTTDHRQKYLGLS